MCSQCDKECEFPGDAHGPLHHDEALRWLAPLEDMYGHTLQGDPSDRAEDSDGAGDRMLQWLWTSRPLLRPAWVHITSHTPIKVEHRLLRVFVQLLMKMWWYCKVWSAGGRQVIGVTFQSVALCARHQMGAQKKNLAANIWPVMCYFLLNEAVNRSDELTAKPGSCPTADGLCPRSKDCEWDMDCPGWQKCCRFLCTDPTS